MTFIIVFLLGILWGIEEVYLGGWLKNLNMIAAGLWISFFTVVIILYSLKVKMLIDLSFLRMQKSPY